MEAEECCIYLESTQPGGLQLSCGHTLHAGCALELFREEPVAAWRCPTCRQSVEPGRCRAASSLPAAQRCAFSPPPPEPVDGGTDGSDLEEGACGRPKSSSCCLSSPSVLPLSSLAGAGGGVSRRPSSAGGRLVAIERFAANAAAALQEEKEAELKGGKGLLGGRPAGAPLAAAAAGVPSAALRLAERLLPEPALEAAASALASARLRQLQTGGRNSLGLAAAGWFGALLFLVGGGALGAFLLGRFISLGLWALCRLNKRVSLLAGFVVQASCLALLETEPPTWLVGLFSFAALLVVAEAMRQRACPRGRGRLLAWLLLRLEAEAPRLLFAMYAVSFSLTTFILILSMCLNLATILAAWFWQPYPEPPHLLYLSASLLPSPPPELSSPTPLPM